MSLDKNKNKTFFGDNPRYWIGKIVSLDENGSQKVLTKKVKPGLLKNQEKSETNTPVVPILDAKANKGNGKGKATPVGQLKNLAGGTDEENAVGAFGKLSGNAEPLTGVEKAQKLARERIESGKTIQQGKDANTQAMRDRARERNAAFRAQNYE